MELADHVIGICSWSLECPSLEETARAVRELSLCHLHLALAPLIDHGVEAVDNAMKVLEKQQVTLTAGMIGFAGEDYTTIATIRQTGGFVSDAMWDQRRRVIESAAKAAKWLNLEMVSTHIGFVPSSNEPGYAKMVERVKEASNIFQSQGVILLMETGQESANELLQFFNDVSHPNIAINMDPANMILYGAGNPVEAVQILGRHVKHVHIKDAVTSGKPGINWGQEVPFGKGQVNALAFIESLRFGGYRGPLMIEREAGASRMADIRHAIGVLSEILEPHPEASGE